MVTPDGVEEKAPAKKKMKICAFLWTYYGYPTSDYEGKNVEQMRYDCGRILAKNDTIERDRLDFVAGVPDSGTAHAIGYANESGVPFARPFMKYTPTWSRSFYAAEPEDAQSCGTYEADPGGLFDPRQTPFVIDDSIVRGTQMGETVSFLYDSGAKEVHIRPQCPPILFGCKYLNFSRSTSDMI